MRIKSRQVFFCIIATLFICGPIILYCSTHFCNIELPPWVTSEEADYLAGNKQSAEISKHLNIQAIIDEQLQDAVSNTIENSIPFKAAANIGSADIQRILISASTACTPWKCYPTFYGSSIAYDPDSNSLWASTMLDRDSDIFDSVASNNAYLSQLIESTDVRWVYLSPDTTDLTAASPIFNLSTNNVSYQEYCDIIASQLPEKCTVVRCEYTDAMEYSSKFLRSDGHPQVLAGLDMYNAIATELDRLSPEITDATVYPAYTEGAIGGAGRTGRTTKVVDEIIYDISFGDATINVKINGEKTDASSIDESYSSNPHYSKKTIYDNMYAEWFHSDLALIEMSTCEYSGKPGSLLIISDSMDNCWSRFFLASYEKVYELDPRHYTEGTIQDFLAAHQDVCDVVFIMRASINHYIAPKAQNLFAIRI